MNSFYFSQKQRESYNSNNLSHKMPALMQVYVDGNLMEFTQQCKDEYTGLWDDVISLGKAKPCDVVIDGIKQ